MLPSLARCLLGLWVAVLGIWGSAQQVDYFQTIAHLYEHHHIHSLGVDHNHDHPTHARSDSDQHHGGQPYHDHAEDLQLATPVVGLIQPSLNAATPQLVLEGEISARASHGSPCPDLGSLFRPPIA